MHSVTFLGKARKSGIDHFCCDGAQTAEIEYRVWRNRNPPELCLDETHKYVKLSLSGIWGVLTELIKISTT